MTTNSDVHSAADSGPRAISVGKYFVLTAILAFVAASAAYTSVLLTLPTWAMFMGWVSYFTRRPSILEGLRSLGCVVAGLCLGAIATMLIGGGLPILGRFAFPLVVFCVAFLVLGTRALPHFNNLLGYFIGLITFFASHLPAEPESVVMLASSASLGSIAGWAA
ncbi:MULTISPECIES: DUF1097 domain-containing protein [unclassified Cupriavidus]|uniref:DUF1097 domain-containing protein n=1 Tax=unclassified Cupriavidus TaxID=2640874 RepID=UPI00313EBC5E